MCCFTIQHAQPQRDVSEVIVYDRMAEIGSILSVTMIISEDTNGSARRKINCSVTRSTHTWRRGTVR